MPFLFQTSTFACKFYREVLLHWVFLVLNMFFVRRHKHLLMYKYLDVVNSGGEPRRWNKRSNASTITITLCYCFYKKKKQNNFLLDTFQYTEPRFSSMETICKRPGIYRLTHLSPMFTTWKVSKYGVISGTYFPVFGPEITLYLDTFHAVVPLGFLMFLWGGREMEHLC